MAWIAIGSLVLHVAVKLPLVRHALSHDVDDTELDRPGATEPGAAEPPRPAAATWLATGAVVLATAGSTVPFLRRVSVLAVRSGEGPQGVPINKTAEDAGVTDAARTRGGASRSSTATRSVSLSREELLALPQRTEELPIACVEGWSASGTWSGVRLRDLLDLVEAPQRRRGGPHLAAGVRSVPRDAAAGRLRRRRPHPGRPRALRRASSTSTTASRPG